MGAFFSGTNAPFLRPLVGNKTFSAGGMISYVPLPYRSSCRITTTWFPPTSSRPQNATPRDWGYYQITGHAYDTPDGVATWTGDEDLTEVLRQWTSVGADPKPQEGVVALTGTVTVPAGTNTLLASYDEPGCLTAILLQPPQPAAPNLLADVRLQLFWDGETEPSVDAPLGEFFGSGFGETNVASLMIGMRTNGPYYCYFPMPFWSSAVVRAVNTGAQDLSSLAFDIRSRPHDYDRALTGSFMARHTVRHLPGDGSDYPLLVEQGRGHLVGVSLSMQAGDAVVYGSGLTFLEVDERLFVDGAQSPALHGTGLEDYFNCGWYYQGGRTLNLPCHGLPVRRLLWAQPYNYATTYRHHLSDVLPFESGIRFLMEVVPSFMPDDTWSSVTYYYKLPGTLSGLRLVAEIQTGDPASEAAAGYVVSGAATIHTNTWRFPGRHPYVAETFRGRRLAGGITFSVPLETPQAGLLLRRRMDAGMGGQRAAVYADDDFAGLWNWPDHAFTNTEHRWHDAVFVLDRGFTSGKTGLVVRVERDPEGSEQWTDYGWQVFAIEPLNSPLDTDRDGLPDAWEVRYFGRAGLHGGSDDPDGDSASNAEEQAADTDPNDPHSFFRISGAASAPGRTFRFRSSAQRFYTLYGTDDLREGSWTPVPGAGPLPGSGGEDSLSDTNDPPAGAFYRLGVNVLP